EAGHITYMRTDSVNLGKDAAAALVALAAKEFGAAYAQAHTYKTKSKNAQEAHEAIRPTDPARASAGATADETALYGLIRTRAIASQMAPARLLRTSVKAQATAADG